MKKILIIKTGGVVAPVDGKEGDFEDWTAAGMGLDSDQFEVVDVQKGDPLPEPHSIAGVAITGAHEMVTDGDQWIEDTASWVREAVSAGIPMLGICFGHQLMAQALGGEAGYHPEGLEIGTVPVRLTDDGRADPLLGGLPDTFLAHVTHSQTVLTLPQGAVLLAASDHDPHQAFRVGHHAWGVQFHPEFDATALRDEVVQLEKTIVDQDGDPDAIYKAVQETPIAAGVLKRFADHCLE